MKALTDGPRPAILVPDWADVPIEHQRAVLVLVGCAMIDVLKLYPAIDRRIGGGAGRLSILDALAAAIEHLERGAK